MILGPNGKCAGITPEQALRELGRKLVAAEERGTFAILGIPRRKPPEVADGS